MSAAKTPRDWLNAHTDAARQLELNNVAIDVLESCNTNAARVCCRILQAEQQRQLTKLDKAAAKLGAPYPGT